MTSLRNLSLRAIAEKRNKILITRAIGGLGDILMHRMLFEDFKALAPDVEIHFSCPEVYHPAVSDHPYIDRVLGLNIDPSDYILAYDTTTACGNYEQKIAPLSDLHRSDIWSRHCGVELKNHSMHITLSPQEKQYGRDLVGDMDVLVCPISSMTGKDLDHSQITGVMEGLRARGHSPFILHNKYLPEFGDEMVITGQTVRQWMGVVDAARCVVSVDTASFHLAGGLGKPLVGIFSFADGKVYGKYYDFELVQRHRDNGWDCGPCYLWRKCPKTPGPRKPCITELASEEILDAFDKVAAR